jgi:hypothetical protein
VSLRVLSWCGLLSGHGGDGLRGGVGGGAGVGVWAGCRPVFAGGLAVADTWYVRGLLAPVARKNRWYLAELAGHRDPAGSPLGCGRGP